MARDSQWDGAARPAPQPERRRVLRAPLKVVSPLKLWIVSPEVQPVHAHWTGRRNALCRIDLREPTCPHCADQLPRRMEYWLTVQDVMISRPPALLRLTPGAVRGCPVLLREEGSLHGYGLSVWREPANATGWLRAQLHDVTAPRVLWEAPGTWETLLLMDQAQLRAEYRPAPRLHQPPTDVDDLTAGL